MTELLFRSTLETPYGRLNLAMNADGVLVELLLPNRAAPIASTQTLPPAAEEGMRAVQAQLNEYFLCARRTFDVPIDPHGTPFERRVWTRLREIPYGATTSYGTIAMEFGLRSGARAVGRANGANPIPIIIPCHRVIGADGRLTGFGGGLPLKRALLELEGALLGLEGPPG